MRYANYDDEFQTIDVLGQGSQGLVTKSIRKIDGQEYAVKKITIDKDKGDKMINLTKKSVI
jgi:serine/threonine protein kinase